MMFDRPILSALMIYLITCYLLFSIKHPKMFEKNGDFKTFGLQEDQTIFPFWLVTSVIGLFSYYLILVTNGDFMSE
jgi:hypothetical protein